MKIPSALSTLIPIYVLCGCTAPSLSVTPISSSSWKSEHFNVRFIPREITDGRERSTSRYEITPTRPGTEQLFASSAQTISGFNTVTNPAPSNYIKVFADAHSEALIIQEVIPNDCAPCTNYIWVRPASSTKFTHSYLQLPSRGLDDPASIEYEMPKVVTIRKGQLTYKYSKGKHITVNLDQIPTSSEPTNPG